VGHTAIIYSTGFAGRVALETANAPADSIQDVGFLSPHVAHYVQKHRKENAPLFEIADELNRVGQRALAEAQITVTEKGAADPKLIAALLLIRTLSNFQGAILLTERGMIVEALTLARCCFENAYVLAALKKEGDAFVKDMVAAELHARKGQSLWMLDDPSRLKFVPEGVERMKKNVDEIRASGKTVALDFKDAAERGEIPDFYIWYKNLSWMAAHPSLQSLSRYLGKEEEVGKATLIWGPEGDEKDVGDAMHYCLPAVFGVLLHCTDELGTKNAQEEVSALWHRYKEMAVPKRSSAE